MMRWLIRGAALMALGIAACNGPCVFEKSPVMLVGGPMIQYGNYDGRNGMIVTWRTDKDAVGKIEYREAKSQYCSERSTYSQEGRHVFWLGDLRPYRVYSYKIYADNFEIGRGEFRTGRRAHERFFFTVFGDSGSGTPDQYAVAEAVAERDPDLIIHTGDLVYSKGEDENYPGKFYKPYARLIANAPFFPSLGNHDCGTADGGPFLKNFFLPGYDFWADRNRRYYSFDYGNSHFVALDSNQITDEQTDWLKRDLAKSGARWKFVFFHHPVFSNNRKNTETDAIKEIWKPVFEEYGVDIVFNGHDHIYTRFQPVKNVTYIVEGVGGKNRYELAGNDPRVAFTDNQHFGFGLVDMEGDRLTFWHYALTDQGVKIWDCLYLAK